jgi:hypothetical protein
LKLLCGLGLFCFSPFHARNIPKGRGLHLTTPNKCLFFLHEASHPHSSAGKKIYVETYIPGQSSTHTRTQVRVKKIVWDIVAERRKILPKTENLPARTIRFRSFRSSSCPCSSPSQSLLLELALPFIPSWKTRVFSEMTTDSPPTHFPPPHMSSKTHAQIQSMPNEARPDSYDGQWWFP